MLESFNHWLIFNVALVVLLVFDLLILTRGNREVGMKEAAWLTVFWTLVLSPIMVKFSHEKAFRDLGSGFDFVCNIS